jgi:regulator of cell morphogenesis and NO signaling
MSTSERTIGEIVAGDYRTAKVFESHKIDFCCGGNVALAAACKAKGIDLAAITRELDAVKSEPVERSQNYASWELPFLADYIINAHHTYLKENTGQISAYAHKIASVHGVHHPEVVDIATIFDRIAIYGKKRRSSFRPSSEPMRPEKQAQHRQRKTSQRSRPHSRNSVTSTK